MKRSLLAGVGLALLMLAPSGVYAGNAQQVGGVGLSGTTCTNGAVNVGNNQPIAVDAQGKLCINAAGTGGGAITGTTSNAASGVATSSTNVSTVAYTYGFNGTTWDQLQVDANKYLKTAVQSGNLTADTHAQCSALCANLVVKGTSGTLKTFEVSADSTLSGAIWYVMVYDATSAPADGAVTPAKCYQQPSGTTQMGGTLSSGGSAFLTGITIGVSTTGCFSKTASTHAFIAADNQ